MKKLTIVEMLKDAGYAESQNPEMYSGCEHVILSKTYEDEVEVCWYGKQKSSLTVELFVNIRSGICRADFRKDNRNPYKSRWYDTIGKRTFNAISETVRNAGFAI